MKREQFSITSTKGHNVIKYKWNSARKEVQRLVQEYVNENGGEWLLSREESEKNGFYHVSGMVAYKNIQSGEEVIFSIEKLDDSNSLSTDVK